MLYPDVALLRARVPSIAKVERPLFSVRDIEGGATLGSAIALALVAYTRVLFILVGREGR